MALATERSTPPEGPDGLRRLAATTPDVSALVDLATSDDVGVLCLVATRPETPADAVERLVAHPDAAVRRAAAHRRDLSDDQIRRLSLDPERSVRRAAHRRQSLDIETVLELRRRGLESSASTARLAALIADPSVTSTLLADDATAIWAAGGVLDDRTVRRSFRERAIWIRRHLAATCVFGPRGREHVANDADRLVQEAVVRRSDLTDAQRRRLVRRGGVWAAAAILGEHRDRRLVAAARRRRHPVVRRRCAQFESNPALLWWWGIRPSWAVARALASNPHVGPRLQRRLIARQTMWSVASVLAARPDVARVVRSLGAAPPIQFALAQNPATPAEVVAELRTSRDPYVRGLASVHPNTPAAAAHALLVDPDQPAWVVRRAALREDLPSDDREAALAWLALGGGVGDPHFDPVTCMGTPDLSQPGQVAYDREAHRNGIESVLWRARALVGQRADRLGNHRLFALARDEHPAVRRVAAGYLLIDTLAELRWDEDHAVSLVAENSSSRSEVQSLRSPPRQRSRWRWALAALPLWIVSWAVNAMVEPVDRSTSPFVPAVSVAPAADDLSTADTTGGIVLTPLVNSTVLYPGRLLHLCEVAGLDIMLRTDGGLLLSFDVTGDVGRIVEVDDLNSVAVALHERIIIRLPTFDDAIPTDSIRISAPGSTTYPTPIELQVDRAAQRIVGEGCE